MQYQHNMDNNKKREKELLLDLSTDTVKAHIKIDDVLYGLVDIADLSITNRLKLIELGNLLAGVGDIKTDEDEERCNQALQTLLSFIVIDINTDILQKLSIIKKIEIVNAYMDVSDLVKKNTK